MAGRNTAGTSGIARAARPCWEPLEITNPQANLLGITAIYISNIAIPSKPRDGVVTLQFEALEWMPAPKPLTKGAGSPNTKAKTDEEIREDLSEALATALINGDAAGVEMLGNMINQMG